MKQIVLVIALVVLAMGAYAQEPEQGEPRKFYLGVSTGINQGTGLIGPTFEYEVAHNLTVNGAVGLASWGYKATGGIKYYLNYPGSWAFSLGYSYATGLNDFSVEFEDGFVQGTSGKQTVIIDLLPASTVNISAIKYWLLGKQKKNRLHLELGYAIATADNRYETSATLTKEGKNFMTILQPGGLLLGVGFSFGLW